jgi:hypothetical protein
MTTRARILAATFGALAILASGLASVAAAKTHDTARSYDRPVDSACTTDEGGGRRLPCGAGGGS